MVNSAFALRLAACRSTRLRTPPTVLQCAQSPPRLALWRACSSRADADVSAAADAIVALSSDRQRVAQWLQEYFDWRLLTPKVAEAMPQEAVDKFDEFQAEKVCDVFKVRYAFRDRDVELSELKIAAAELQHAAKQERDRAAEAESYYQQKLAALREEAEAVRWKKEDEVRAQRDEFEAHKREAQRQLKFGGVLSPATVVTPLFICTCRPLHHAAVHECRSAGALHATHAAFRITA